MVGDFFMGPVYGSSPFLLTVYKGHLYFRGQIGTGDMQLLRSDGTYAGTKVVRPANATVQKNCAAWFTTQLFLNPTHDAIYFAAEYTSTGYELWSLKDTTVAVQSISGISTSPDFVLYPNPNSGTFNLALDNTRYRNATVHVYDMIGRLCYSASVTEPNTVISMNKAPGIYIVRFQMDDVVLTKHITLR